MLRYPEASGIDRRTAQILREYAQDDSSARVTRPLGDNRRVRRRADRRVHRRGVSVILVSVLLVVLIAFVSLAVDVGRVRLARAEVETAADAAARAGAQSLPFNIDAAITHALRAAAMNLVIDSDRQDGSRTDTPTAIDTFEDIHFCVYNRSTHALQEVFDLPQTTGRDERRSANAMLVYARRLQSRNNAVKLIFAPVVGVFNSEMELSAVAYVRGGFDHNQANGVDNFSFVGLEGINVTGNHPEIFGNLASDGDIHLRNADVRSLPAQGPLPKVDGDVRVLEGRELTHGVTSVIAGWTADRHYPIASRYPVQTPPGTAINLPSDGVLSGGTSPAKPKSYEGAVPETLRISGYVHIYATSMPKWPTIIWQDFNDGNPNRLLFFIQPTVGTLDIDNTQHAFTRIDAPRTDLTFSGTGNFTGRVVGRTLTFASGATYTTDRAKEANSAPPYHVNLAQ